MRLKDQITSETVFFAWGVIQQIIALILVSHVIGSVWYFIGDMSGSSGMHNWIDEFDMKDEAFVYRYTSAFHWSISHFGQSTNFLRPVNWPERLYAIFVSIISMVMVFLVIASIVTSLMKLIDSGGETDQSFWLLRRYMRQHELPAPLVTRILRFLEYKIAQLAKTVPENKVEGILGLLSENLYNELKFEAEFAVMRGHPLVEHAEEHAAVLIQGMVQAKAPNHTPVLKVKQYSEDDIVFTDQAVENFMFFVCSGDLTYMRVQDDGSMKDHKMQVGDWLLEAVLWVPWMSQGVLESSNESSVCLLDARLFVEDIKLDTQMFDLMCNYAIHFAEWLSNLPSDRISDLSPLQNVKRILDQAIAGADDPNHSNDGD